MNDREQFELLVAKDWDAHDLPNFDLNPLGDYVDDEMFSAFAWFKKGRDTLRSAIIATLKGE